MNSSVPRDITEAAAAAAVAAPNTGAPLAPASVPSAFSAASVMPAAALLLARLMSEPASLVRTMPSVAALSLAVTPVCDATSFKAFTASAKPAAVLPVTLKVTLAAVVLSPLTAREIAPVAANLSSDTLRAEAVTPVASANALMAAAAVAAVSVAVKVAVLVCKPAITTVPANDVAVAAASTNFVALS